MAKPGELDIKEVRVLDALLRHHSTVRAARELGVSQSAVSHSLRRLRAIFGDPLFVRVGNRLSPTAAADDLRTACVETLAAVERLMSSGRAFQPCRLTYEFRVFSADYGEAVVLPSLLHILGAEAPGCAVWSRLVGDDVEAMLQQGEADFALGAFFQARSGLHRRVLFRDDFVLANRVEHAPTTSDFLKARHALVAPRGVPGSVVDEQLAEQGKKRQVVLRTASFQTALHALQTTDLWLTLPRRLATAMATVHRLNIHEHPLSLPDFPFCLLFAESRRDDPKHRWIRERLAAALGSRGE